MPTENEQPRNIQTEVPDATRPSAEEGLRLATAFYRIRTREGRDAVLALAQQFTADPDV